MARQARRYEDGHGCPVPLRVYQRVRHTPSLRAGLFFVLSKR